MILKRNSSNRISHESEYRTIHKGMFIVETKDGAYMRDIYRERERGGEGGESERERQVKPR